MSRRRTLTQDERALWTYVTRHVAPLSARLAVAEEELALLEAVVNPKKAPPPPLPKKPKDQKTAAPVPAAKAPQPPPLVPLERRLRQRLSRGAHPIEAVLDLHGMRQEEAHHRLRGFLLSAQAGGAAVVLVVTGKGAAATDTHPGHPGERGVLRRVVPHWLRLPDLRAVVLGFEEAAQHHGGGGALYVRLRKRREA
jgi:DNA-nicking Smr family endonuclease